MKKYILLLGACIMLGSCSAPETPTSEEITGGSSQALVYLSCKAVSEDEFEFVFSSPVTITSLTFYPDIPIASIKNGSVVRVKLEENTEPGVLITADLLAEDDKRNSINVVVSFRARNNRMPNLVINEICTEYSNPRTEFIEFKMKSDGNLGAMRVVIHGNTNASRQTIFEFAPVEVSRNDYVVLHLRTVEDSCKDEYGSNLAESGGRNASPTARDFWFPGNTKRMHKEATVIYVLDQDDRIINAVMLSTENEMQWGKDYLNEAAEFLFSQGAWLSKDGNIPGPADAIRTAGTTNTRTINRDEKIENTNSAANWYITVTSGLTPGNPNNTGRFSN
jgi:hypothetical protein